MSPVPRPVPRTTTVTLYDLRLCAGYTTQASLAARLGMSRSNYGRIERGMQNPRPARLVRMARLLNIPVQELREVLGCRIGKALREAGDGARQGR
jgi:transcriptional regulator with XRE-family HTH domain